MRLSLLQPARGSKRQLENKVGEKGLWVKIPVIGQKIVVQPDAVFVAKNSVQNLCSLHIRFVFVTSVLANLTKFLALDSLQKHIIAVNNWKEKILVNFVNIVANCILDSGARVFTVNLSTSVLETFWTRLILKRIAKEPGTMSSVLSCLG